MWVLFYCRAIVQWRRLSLTGRRGRKYCQEMHERILSILPKPDLERLYFSELVSTKLLAKRYGVSQSCIYNLFQRYGLKTRTLQEAMLLRRKPSTRHKRIRERAVRLLGGICAHCGCDGMRILEIHHKEGGGRPETRTSSKFYYNITMGRRNTSDL